MLEREHVILCAELSELAHYALVLGVGALLAVEDRLGRVGAGLALRSAAAAATVPGPPKLLPSTVQLGAEVLVRARAAFALHDPWDHAISCLHMPTARTELIRAHVARVCSRACSLVPCDTYTCQQLVLAVGSRSRSLRGMTLTYANSCVTLSHASSSYVLSCLLPRAA